MCSCKRDFMNKQKIAVVFPGQGSQSLGMLKELSERYPIITQTFSEASSIVGENLWTLAQEGPIEKINLTAWTQPLLLASDVAMWRVLSNLFPNLNQKIAFLAGHSLGEYAALVASGAIDFNLAMQFIILRGLAMQNAVPENVGAMGAIIGLEEPIVEVICEQIVSENKTISFPVLAPANFNSLGQTVISGHRKLVNAALDLAKQAGAKLAVLLPVSVPSHCQLMMPAQKVMEKSLKNTKFSNMQIPVIKNIDAKPYSDVSEIGPSLLAQLIQPVQWIETIRFLMNQNVGTIIECGTGRVLSGLNKRIDKSLQLFSTSECGDFFQTMQFLLDANEW